MDLLCMIYNGGVKKKLSKIANKFQQINTLKSR